MANKDFSSAVFESAAMRADGRDHTIRVTHIPLGATVTYNPSNTQSVAGVYNITATITMSGYNTKVMTATLTLYKAYVITFRQFTGQREFEVKEGQSFDLNLIPKIDPIEGYFASWESFNPALTAHLLVNAIYYKLPTEGKYLIDMVSSSGTLILSKDKKFANHVLVKPKLQTLEISENGTYTPENGYCGLSSVVVNCPTVEDEIVVTYPYSGSYTVTPVAATGMKKVTVNVTQANPLTASSEAEAREFLVAERVGCIVKYIGESTSNFVKNALYIVKENNNGN